MKFFYKSLLVAAIILTGANPLYAIPVSDPANRHNFSSWSTSDVQAIDIGDPVRNDTRVCVFCHTPHSASSESVLWNRAAPVTAGFATYANGDPSELAINDPAGAKGVGSANYDNGGNYPNGASRMCLSCHDGATAFNDILVGDFIDMNYTDFNDYVSTGGGNPGNVITAAGMASVHPVSFVYDANSIADINLWHATPPNDDLAVFGFDLIAPGITPLDSQSRMQCTTCHDPHNDVSVSGSPFWRHTDYNQVCDNCHSGGPVANPGTHGT